MNILFYRYGSICEPDILSVFESFGLSVTVEDAEITDKSVTPAQCVQLVSRHLLEAAYTFVFSVNFYPAIADICSRLQVYYVCWTVDSPVMELFSASISRPFNRIFMFDYAQYERFLPFHPQGIFYLPLAANVSRLDGVVASITPEERIRYQADISFVGSLYREKSPLAQSNALSEYTRGYLDALLTSQFLIHGCCFLEEAMSEQVIKELKHIFPHFYHAQNTCCDTDRYTAAHQYAAMQLAVLEREQILNALGARHQVSLYTRSDSSRLTQVKNCGGVQTLTEMPKVFHLSKINLNITLRSIRSGIPLRVWDVLGCGGFLLTNYQSELPEYFEAGRDLETYSGLDELLEKAAYYLAHDEERRQIAQNGYEKVKKLHTYEVRLAAMLRILAEHM